ncbi:hypothetical protein M768_11175 [Cellulosimicrobium cellulans F16]|uniref:Oxygen sensor histidine kinase NreB n=1 Tax=Cellulosimicrobium cellulans F16 TaxID=1350482 RepID=A0A0M0F8J6_CELCE|nr:hypothetical protein M768_11175 [Cellulosimicrobium cellulans F16]
MRRTRDAYRGSVPTDLPAPPAEARPAAGRALDVGVHATFLALVATSTTRYVVRHGADDRWQLVVVLAAVTVVAYGALLVASRHASSRSVPARAATLVLLATWSVLALLAPSFAWCALPLFFVCRLGFRPPWSHVLVGEVAVVTSVALLRLSDGTDWAALVGPPCVAVLLTLVTDRVERDAAARVQLQEQIAQAQARLARSEREAGIVAERERLAREIHDTVTQGLASGVLLLEAADQTWDAAPDDARSAVRRAAVAVRASLADTRNLVHDLASARVDPDGFHASLLAAAQGQVPSACLTTWGDARAVAPEVAHALLRVTQSAAANVAQHAAADRLDVTLTYLPGAVALDVYDDGSGFDPEAVAAPSSTGGYGLRAMRRRVTRLGGTVTVESAPGEGTVVAAQVPTDDDAPAVPVGDDLEEGSR